MGEPTPGRGEEIARRILDAPKYRTLDPAFVRRVAEFAAHRFPDTKTSVKYAKRRLHQAFGAFVTTAPAPAVDAAVDAIRTDRTDARTALREAMQAHASTAERLAWLKPFYEQVSDWCGRASSVVDLACGLNPLAIPWMDLASDADYWCCDVDTALVAALARLGDVLPVRVDSAACDLVASPPQLRAEVALMLKLVNTLEQQDGSAATRILRGLDCAHVLLSVPRRSLSGRKSYQVDVGELLQRITAGTGYALRDQQLFGDELLCHLTRASAARALGSGSGREPAPQQPAGGQLTLVGTPIGNLGDLTTRARQVLQEADVICAEDTRRTRKLLTAYDIHPRRLVSVRAENELRSVALVRQWIDAGRQVALVTDAGMPALSDPGQRLVRQLLDAGVRVSAAPGPDAATTALSMSGLPAESWCFEGFLPAAGGGRTRRLAALAGEPRTVVLFEAPHRLRRTLADLSASLGTERPVAVLNDLTKRFEQVWWGSLGEVVTRLHEVQVRGEFVVVIGPDGPSGPARPGAGT